jgi:hypothetical protein
MQTIEHLRGGGVARVMAESADGRLAPVAILDGTDFNARGNHAHFRSEETVVDSIIVSLVRRYMKGCPSFVQNDGSKRVPLEIPLDAGERIIGWYSNPPPWERILVLFSTNAIYSVENGEIEKTLWSDVIGYESPTSKADIQGVALQTVHGPRFVRVAGSHGPSGKYKDAFGFVMIVRAMRTTGG